MFTGAVGPETWPYLMRRSSTSRAMALSTTQMCQYKNQDINHDWPHAQLGSWSSTGKHPWDQRGHTSWAPPKTPIPSVTTSTKAQLSLHPTSHLCCRGILPTNVNVVDGLQVRQHRHGGPVTTGVRSLDDYRHV